MSRDELIQEIINIQNSKKDLFVEVTTEEKLNECSAEELYTILNISKNVR